MLIVAEREKNINEFTHLVEEAEQRASAGITY